MKQEDLVKDVSKKAYAVGLGLGFVAIFILVKIISLQAFPDEEVMKLGESKAYRISDISPNRGQIFSADGSLLATSIPIYEIRWDSKAKYDANEFNAKLDSLARGFSAVVGDKSALDYKSIFKKARKKGDRYLKVADKIDYNQLQRLKKVPFFSKGRYKSGFIVIEKSKRKKPFGSLAARTIGLNREDNQVGLELAYDSLLAGKPGKQLMEKMAGGEWRPMNDEYLEQPEPGLDIVATIDVHLQDVAQSALTRQLQASNADWGCAVLMEVNTGYVKAIANLKYNEKTQAYEELINYAISQSVEPGSTFKLPSMMAMLDDNLIRLEDSVATGNGVLQLYQQTLRDSNHDKGGNGTITAEQVFEKSSNVGTALLAKRAFEKKPQRFLDKLHSFGLGEKLNIELSGERAPKLYKKTKDKGWSGLSLTQISIGYETQYTPLQILSFYNAVANNGKLIRPLFVQEVKRNGRTIEKKEPIVINEQICKKETLALCKRMMEGVMEPGGTAEKVFLTSPYKVAGKTGTARISEGSGYQEGAFRGSFVGYFPAHKPRYSCIVVIHNPKNGLYYGSAVAAPVFKELADKIYSTELEFHEDPALKDSLAMANAKVPVSKNGNAKDLLTIYKALNISYDGEDKSEYVITSSDQKRVHLQPYSPTKGKVPNVVGMGLQDALFLLEKEGLKVQALGKGTVKRQSIPHGAISKNYKSITIELS